MARAKFELEHVFLRPVSTQAARIDELLAEEPAGTVVVETMFFGAIPLALRSQRPRLVAWGSNPLNLPGEGVAPTGTGWTPATGPLGRLRNRAAAFALRKLFAESLPGLVPGLPVPLFDWLELADDIVQLTVPGFEYPRPGARVHFVGPLSVSDTDRQPLPQWWDRLDRRRPTVLVTQGSAEPELSQLVQPTLTALADREVNVVVSLGGLSDTHELSLPANAFAASALPYDAIFPSLSAFVTNGGYGGLGFAIRHGVPVVTVGKSQDKAEVAARVRWSGLGIGLRRQEVAPRTIGRAVGEVLRAPRYRTRAAALREEAARAPGLAGAARVLVEGD